MQRLALAAGTLAAIFVLAGCSDGGSDQLHQQQKGAVAQRASAFARATAKYPAPLTENFPNRATLVELTKRDDLVNHPWYVYLLGMNGNVIGYYVAKSDPVNACDFLSSTQDVSEHGDNSTGVAITEAPSLDGIYYGGAGTSAGCDAWVFLDYSTNALIKIRGLAFYVADQPLRIEASAIKVAQRP